MLVLIHNPIPTIVLFIMISKKILCFQVFSTMSYYGVLIMNEYCLCLVHTNGLFCIDNVMTVSVAPQVLLYNGQPDIIVGVPLTESMLQVLQWSGRHAYLKADTQVTPLYTYSTYV